MMYFIEKDNIGFIQYSQEYVKTIVDWINDREVNKFFSLYTPITEQSLSKVIDRFSTSDNEIGFVVELVDQKRAIAIIEIREIDYVARKCEIEFAIGEKDLWNQGYGTRIWKILDNYLFSDLNMHRVYLHTMEENTGMQKLAEKFDYYIEGKHIDALFKDGEYYNELVMAKVKMGKKCVDKNIPDNVLAIIGNTPVVKLNNIKGNYDGNVYGKIEYYNPSGSVKDRASYNMILEAEKNGLINKDTTIVEATSGNVGISLAMICAIKKLKLIITAPEGVIPGAKLKLLNALGAKVIFNPLEKGYEEAIENARKLKNKIENSFMCSQFDNPNNYKAHQKWTAKEILKTFGTNLDYIVACLGSGGTLTGLAKTLKDKIPNLKVIAVEPATCTVLSENKVVDDHYILGIGPGFIPDVLDVNIIDKVITVTDTEAADSCIELARKEGIYCGISSGAAIKATQKLLTKIEKEKNILTILPDNGLRYAEKKGFFNDYIENVFENEKLNQYWN